MSDAVVPENLAAVSNRRSHQSAVAQSSTPPSSPPLESLIESTSDAPLAPLAREQQRVPSTPATIAQDELILARSDLATALKALSTHERVLLARVAPRIRTIRRATRFCSVVPVLIPGVWAILTPRLRRMWQDERELDGAPRVKVLFRELERAKPEEKAEHAEADAAVEAVLARNELRWLMRLATFAPPAFMIAIVIAIHYAVF